jgi:hypothetical protein
VFFGGGPAERAPQVKTEFAAGGAFAFREVSVQNSEGILAEKGIACVLVAAFGRQVPVDVEYRQLAKAGGG